METNNSAVAVAPSWLVGALEALEPDSEVEDDLYDSENLELPLGFV